MGYEILSHTADVGIAAHGPDPPALFAEAARAMAAVILDTDPPPPEGAEGARAEPIEAAGEDLASTLAAFLEECLYRFEVEGGLVVGAALDVSETRAAGTVVTCTGLVPEGPQIKAVTYHQLRVEQEDGGWRATVYFDV